MAEVDAAALEEMARAALATGDEEAALAKLGPAAERSGNARLWQYSGLLHRSLDQHSAALHCFATAERLAPADESIARGHARVALEAGVYAVELFDRAMLLAPGNGAVLLGLVAAKFAAGRGVEAEAQLDRAVDRSPLWIEGHVQLAQLRSMLGLDLPFGASIERALAARPADQSLWTALLNLALTAEDFPALDKIAGRARRANMPVSVADSFEAIAASEQGMIDRADRLFDAMDSKLLAAISLWRVRHLLRAQRLDQALLLVDQGIASDKPAEFWPYALIAWRAAADPRWRWLEAEGQLVWEIDIADRLEPMRALASVLRSLHVAKGEYLDQSVRGGTQTDGPLLSRVELEIQSLRAAIVDAVEDYRSKLPAIDPQHPLLRYKRDRRVRFAGSWSVRLKGAGYHVSHVHPQGWISSALYLSLPEGGADDPAHAGWLKLGEPPSTLGLDLRATRLVEPKAGRLVLFPSWMWHTTVPFNDGERLTVAFDVRPPI